MNLFNAALLSLLIVSACHPTQQNTSQPILLLDFIQKEFATFQNEMSDKIDLSPSYIFCRHAVEGVLEHKRVLHVQTGKDLEAASQCMTEIVLRHPKGFSQIIGAGIAGASSQIGGLHKEEKPTQAVMIGDICISSRARNFDIHHLSGNATSKVVILDGTLETTMRQKLAHFHFSHNPSPTLAFMNFFHKQQRPNRIFYGDQCAEISSNGFWGGFTNEALCRHYTAEVINIGREKKVNEDDVLCISATEGAAWMSVVSRAWPKTPTVNIRSVSDYVYPPLHPQGKPMWSEKQHIDSSYDKSGYAFAAQQVHDLVLFYLRNTTK